MIFQLYYLCQLRQPAFVPTEVHVITTAEGRDHAALTLLHPSQGRFAHFLEDFGLGERIRFDESHIHTLEGHNGQALEDIRTEADNVAAADAITALMRRFTADPTAALHVSIAGGRKTMGFYLGYALTLFGRPQDRLSHVLVSAPFESNHEFYYPPPASRVLFTRENKPINTSDAEITLAEIPFVSLRHGLPAELLAGGASYSETVAAARHSFQPARLVIDLTAQSVRCGEKAVPMPPQIFAWYAWLAKRRSADHPPVRYTDDVAGEFLAVYRLVVGATAHDYEAAAEVLRDGIPREFFQEKKARVNRLLKTALGAGAEAYVIHPSGERPRQHFGLTLAVDAIQFISTTTSQKGEA